MTTAAQIADRLGLTESGDGYYGPCPCCCYEGAFSVAERDGRVLFHCHVGCTQDEVMQALQEWEVWGNPASQVFRVLPDHPTVEPAPSLKLDSRDAALAMWQRSQPAPGTVVENYLRARGYTGPIPAALQYVAGKHPSDEQFHPVMVAPSVDLVNLAIMGIHRTFLRPDGSGKAPLEPSKMSLGDVRGAGVPLLFATHWTRARGFRGDRNRPVCASGDRHPDSGRAFDRRPQSSDAANLCYDSLDRSRPGRAGHQSGTSRRATLASRGTHSAHCETSRGPGF